MAETVKIEIPISATDNTSGGVRSAQRSLNSLDKALEKTQKKMDKLGQGSHKIDIGVSDHATDKMASIEDSADKLDKSTSTIVADVDDNATQSLHNIQDEMAATNGQEAVTEASTEDNATPVIEDVRDELASLNGSEAVVSVNLDDNVTEVLNSIEENIGGAGAAATSGAKLAAGKIAAITGAGFSVVGSSSQFQSFEQEMANVLAISGATESEFEQLTEKAQYMGATTKFTATQSAEALKYMAMAGWDSTQMIAGLPGIMNLAAAAGEDLGTTSDIVTDALTAFGKTADDAGHLSDVLAVASSRSNTNVSMLGESFKYVAPLAGAMKYSMEDTAIALGLMANAGIKSSMSGTSLRRAISNLMNPTDKVKEAMDKYNISLTKENGQMKSLREVMTGLRQNLRGLDDAEKSAAVSSMFGTTALSGMLAIVNASENDWNKMTTAMENTTGATDRMAKTMLDTQEGSLYLMQSAISGTAMSFGERLSPYITGFADAVADAMPDATKAINGFMDQVDILAEKLSNTISIMVNSEEWDNADFLGKIDIAWDKIIVEPFTEWAGGEGAVAVSNVVGSLFENAFKILPGGEEAGLTSWLSAGVIGLGASKFITFAKGLNEFTGPAFLAAAALVALNTAIDAYNQKQVDTSLKDHFGDIKLSADEIDQLSDIILDANWKVNVDVALESIKNADQLRMDATKKLEENEAIEYKAKCGVTLGDADRTTYTDNMTSFITQKLGELQERTYELHLVTDTFIGGSEKGQTLSDAIDKWTLQDTLEMSSLSAQLESAVNDAISDGIMSVDEQAHIHELQDKINSITEGWRSAEAKATERILKNQYGNVSLEELEGGSFIDMQEALHQKRTMDEQYLNDLSKAFYESVYAMEESGRLSEVGLTAEGEGGVLEMWDEAMRHEKEKLLANSIGTQAETLRNAYREEYGAWAKEAASQATMAINHVNDAFEWATDENGNVDYSMINMADILNTFGSGSATNLQPDAGLQALYQNMIPEVDAMREYISNAFDENGEQMYKIPQEIRNAYRKAMEIGAAAGDSDASMQLFAEQLVTSGNEAVINAIQNGELGDGEIQNELREALQRSFAEVGDGISLEDVTVSVEDAELAQGSADRLKAAVDSVLDSLQETGNTVAGEGGAIYKEFEVEAGFTLSGMAAENGLNYEDIKDLILVDGQAPGNADEIEIGQKVVFMVDSMKVEGAEETIGEAKDQFKEQTDSKFEEPIEAPPTDTIADAEYAGDNGTIAAAYNQFAADAQQQFSNPVNVTGRINVSASTSGGGAGADMNASGTYVNGPLLSWIGEDGPEYVIPVGSKYHSRGLDLWMQAGHDLGVPGFAEGGEVGYSSAVPVYSSGSGKGEGTYTVNVSMNPTFTIDSSSDGNVVQAIADRIREMADDVADEIAERIGESFGNMPIRKEA